MSETLSVEEQRYLYERVERLLRVGVQYDQLRSDLSRKGFADEDIFFMLGRARDALR